MNLDRTGKDGKDESGWYRLRPGESTHEDFEDADFVWFPGMEKYKIYKIGFQDILVEGPSGKQTIDSTFVISWFYGYRTAGGRYPQLPPLDAPYYFPTPEDYSHRVTVDIPENERRKREELERQRREARRLFPWILQ